MPIEEDNFAAQARLFSALASELRLRLLSRATEEPLEAPDLADEDEYDVTPETIVNNLNRLEDAGFLESRTVRGPGNHPRKRFEVTENGARLELEVVEDDYHFDFGEAGVYPQ